MQQDAPLFQTEAAIAVEQAVQDATAQDAAQEPAQEAAAVPEVSISHAQHVVRSFSRIASYDMSSSRYLDCCRSVRLRLCCRRVAQTAWAQRQALWRWHWCGCGHVCTGHRPHRCSRASAILAAGAHFWCTWLSRRRDCWTSLCSFQTTQERLLAHLWRHALLLN